MNVISPKDVSTSTSKFSGFEFDTPYNYRADRFKVELIYNKDIVDEIYIDASESFSVYILI